MAKDLFYNTAGTPYPTYGPYGGQFPFSSQELTVGAGLYSLAISPLVHAGGYNIDPTPNGADPNYGLTYSGKVRIAQGTAADRVFFTGHDEGTGGIPFFAEAQVPAIVAGTDINARNEGSILQPYRSIRNDFTQPDQSIVLSGMYYDTASGRLLLGGFQYYAAGNVYPENFMHYADASDLVNSPKVGMYAIGGGAYYGGQIIELPAAWQSAFGASHIVHNGVGMSIVSRSSIGHTAALITPGNSEAGIGARLMEFPYTFDFSTALSPLESAEEGILEDPMWNHLTHVAGGCVIPGTDTLMFIGYTFDEEAGADPQLRQILYKGTDANGDYQDGYAPYYPNARRACYWLYDLNDLAQTLADPITYPNYMQRPYEYGYLDLANSTPWQLPTGMFLNKDTNQIHIAIGGARGFGIPTFEIYSFS